MSTGRSLGLVESWEVTGVELDVAGRKVEVRIGYGAGMLWACPECRERLPCHDHVERSWRHLDACGFEKVLVCRMPRLRDADRKVWTVPAPGTENKALLRTGDERLNGTARPFGYRPERLSGERTARFQSVRYSQLKSSMAWGLKEVFRQFWDYRYEASARKFFARWDGCACRCRIKPMVKAARPLSRHFDNIITYIRHRTSNSVAERLNSKIQSIKANVRGFRSFQNYRTRIRLFCGKLSLYPL